MRISGDGRKVNHNINSKISSSASLENRIRDGSKNINTSFPKEKEIKLNEKFDDKTSSPKIEENINLEEENNNIKSNKKETETKKKKGKTQKPKKEKKPFEIPKEIGKLTGKRITGMVLVGITSSVLLGGICYGVYYNQIRYPRQMIEDVASSGLGGINRWTDAINSLDNSKIKGIIGSDSYLAKEIEYANGDENKIKFFEKIVSTVSYNPNKVKALNRYGNTMIDRNNKVVYTNSLVNGVEEEVTLKYIDYSKIPLDYEKVQSMMKEENVYLGVADYPNRLVDIICKYIVSLDDSNIPLISVKHTPSMVKNGDTYYMTEDEDILLDKLLFSSKEFNDFLVRFSEVAVGEEDNPEWATWNVLSEEEKKDKKEPIKKVTKLKPSSAWSEWNSKSEEEKKTLKEPVKYEHVNVASNTWCGAYYLLNEHIYVDSNGTTIEKPIVAGVGDGSIENPASFDTGIVTSIFVKDSNGNRVPKPIKVKLIDYKVSQDALDYFEGKDTRNRGYDIKSEVQYASYSFEITNLTNETIEVYDDSSLADSLANLAPRTGTVFGLQDKVTLEPYGTGVIESWGSSIELNKKYLIWGKDFKRELPVVWFRVLAGDIEDTTEDKGVTLNKTRFGDDKEAEKRNSF